LGSGAFDLMHDFGYIGILLAVAIFFALTTLLLPVTLRLLGIVPRRSTPTKNSTYECGMPTIGKTWVQYNFRYYFFAVLFVVLDVLLVLLFPWAVGLKTLGLAGLIVVLVLLVMLAVAYVYAWFKGALEWK